MGNNQINTQNGLTYPIVWTPRNDLDLDSQQQPSTQSTIIYSLSKRTKLCCNNWKN